MLKGPCSAGLSVVDGTSLLSAQYCLLKWLYRMGILQVPTGIHWVLACTATLTVRH